MGGKVNVGVDVHFRSVGLTEMGESAHTESLLLPSCNMTSSTLSDQGISCTPEITAEQRTGLGVTTTATTNTSTSYDEAGLIRGGLQGLSLESGVGTDSAPEGIAAGKIEHRNGLQTGGKVVLSSPTELSRRPGTNADVDCVMTQKPFCHVHATQFGESPLVSRGLEIEYRPPPALQLPDQTIMDSELSISHRGRVSDCARSSFRLPAALVGSPSCHSACHDGKASLDPNAKEYTPSPSPCISPVVPHSVMQQHIGVPSSYSFESGHIFVSGQENRSMIVSSGYGSDSALSMYGSDSTISFYGHGSPLAYAPGSVTPPSWVSSDVADVSCHQVCLSVADHISVTPAALARPLQASQSLRTFVKPPFQSMGLPSVGLSGRNILSHPPISSREHVSRAILLNGVPSYMTDEQLKMEMGKWGDVRTVVSDQKHQGLVTVNFYDLRCAKEALRDIQQQHLNKQQWMQQQFQLSQTLRGISSGKHLDTTYQRQDTTNHSDVHSECIGTSTLSVPPGRGLVNGIVMWAQYTLPNGAAAGPDVMNQGTLVVFNLDVDTTMEHLKSVFEAYGEVKELRETPAKKQHKFVEFYDVRDASKALKALDGTEINGKRVKIEFSRPGGQAHKARVQLQQQSQGTTVYHPFNGNRSLLVGSGPGSVAGQPLVMNWSGDTAGTPLTMPGTHGGTSFLWASNVGTPIPPIGLSVPQPSNSGGSQLSTYHYASMQALPASGAGPLVVIGNVDTLSFGKSGSRVMAIPYSGEPVASGGIYPSARESCVISVHNRGVSSRRKRNSSVIGVAGSGKIDSAKSLGSENRLKEAPRVGSRISTNKLAAHADVPPQYAFDEAGVKANEAKRTTLMIKNIPNKYSQQMLLSLLDNHCTEWNKRTEGLNEPESAYDFVYLPIDFKNRCNLGYAFVNCTSVQATMRLYRDFHLQQWEEFNSRKVCHVTYARVQGRLALEEHFKNSRFACDTDDYLPLIFRPPRNGKNASIPATVAAVNQSTRVLGNSLHEHGKGPPCGDGMGDNLPKRVIGNGISHVGQELKLDLSTGQSRCSSLGGHRSNISQQHW